MALITGLNRKFWVNEYSYVLLAYLLATGIALVYGVRSSIYYESQNIPVFWFHLSYHYLASAWTWILLIVVFLKIKQPIESSRQFLFISVGLILPVSALHRALSTLLDSSFRWGMGYTSVTPWMELTRSGDWFMIGLMDSVVAFVIICLIFYAFYVGFSWKRGVSIPKKESIALDPLNRILCKKDDQMHLVELKDVFLFESSGNYIKLFTANHQYLIRGTLKHLEHKLDQNQFFRINRYAIINAGFISYIKPAPEGTYHIFMPDSRKLRTGKVYHHSIRELLNKSSFLSL